jgi:hypothetical protein
MGEEATESPAGSIKAVRTDVHRQAGTVRTRGMIVSITHAERRA